MTLLSACLCVLSNTWKPEQRSSKRVVARQRIYKHIHSETNRHTTVEELLVAVCSMRSVLYQMLSM
jgi:hypothetical protein